jgi:hypothetical protein
MSKYEAGMHVYLSPNESFFWMNRGTQDRKLTGCSPLLTQDTYTVRPGHPEPAQAGPNTGDHEYHCVPPPIRDNPHIIIN